MTRRRWIADEVRGDTAALTGDHADHLVRVLRAQVGQTFDIGTGAAVRHGTITSLSDSRVEFALGQEVAERAIPPVMLALAIFKFDRMEWAIEKCTEIGVAHIVPVIARRTDSHLASAAAKRRERWQRIAVQASEQSRRSAPPEIAVPVKLKELLETQTNILPPLRVVLGESERSTRLRDVFTARGPGAALGIGPEGGWTTDELDSFREAGWVLASLGDTVLRAETAAIVSAAIAMDLLS